MSVWELAYFIPLVIGFLVGTWVFFDDEPSGKMVGTSMIFVSFVPIVNILQVVEFVVLIYSFYKEKG